MEKQNTTESLSSRRRKYVSGAADRVAAARAKDHLAVLETRHLFGPKRHVMRPSALKVRLGDFAFAVGHRRIAISLLPATLNSAAAISIAAASSDASTVPSQTARLASV
jgi:hypothetical protein